VRRFWSSRLFTMVLTLSLPAWVCERSIAEEIPVRHIEGVSLGFLVLRTEDGNPIAYGDLQQVVEKDHVMDDLKFEFKDGSFYEEITKFTQKGKFRLLSNQVVQRGPSFKQPMDSWVDATTGAVTVRTSEKGKEKVITKRLDLPPDLANGLLLIMAKNIDPSAPKTTVSMVAVSTTPRVVKVNFSPQPEATFYVGPVPYKAQQYQLKIEIGGIKGKIAPLVGKQPSDIRLWLIKSEAPTFVKFQGQMFEGGPVWRMELADPRESPPGASNK
jgi:hypothetical protein